VLNLKPSSNEPIGRSAPREEIAADSVRRVMWHTFRTLVIAAAMAAIAAPAPLPAQGTCARGEPLTQDDVFKLVRAGWRK
jgi:hypothetical protein